jgi:hypothetical protein
MPRAASTVDYHTRPGTPLSARTVARIPVAALGLSLSAFLVVSYVLCVLFDLWFPAQAMNPVWSPLLPGFTWLTWPSFFLGLVETFASLPPGLAEMERYRDITA